MPVMNGIEACSRIMEFLSQSTDDTFRAKPLIYALTSESDVRVIDRIRAAGFREIYSLLTE